MKEDDANKAWEDELNIFRKNKEYPPEFQIWNRTTVERWLKIAFLSGIELQEKKVEELFTLVDEYRRQISDDDAIKEGLISELNGVMPYLPLEKATEIDDLIKKYSYEN